jgi:hypothetical protein
MTQAKVQTRFSDSDMECKEYIQAESNQNTGVRANEIESGCSNITGDLVERNGNDIFEGLYND